MIWIVGSNASDPTLELVVTSVVLLGVLGFAIYARHWGALAAAALPASAAVGLGSPAWFTCDQPLDRYEWFLLAWLAALVSASVAAVLLLRPSRATATNVLLELAGEVVVENDGVQWLLRLPRTLGVGVQRGIVELENCHDQERRVSVELREVGTALLNGNDRVQRASIDVTIPAAGFAEVCLPIIVAKAGPAKVHLWVSVCASPRTPRGRVKLQRAGTAQPYNPLYFSTVLKVRDPATMGFGYVVAGDERGTQEPVEASARTLEVGEVRARLRP
jgi:hypothetical protein